MQPRRGVRARRCDKLENAGCIITKGEKGRVLLGKLRMRVVIICELLCETLNEAENCVKDQTIDTIIMTKGLNKRGSHAQSSTLD